MTTSDRRTGGLLVCAALALWLVFSHQRAALEDAEYTSTAAQQRADEAMVSIEELRSR
jgi:hypothetical protein